MVKPLNQKKLNIKKNKLFEDEQKVLAQIGRDFFELKHFKTLGADSAKDLTKLLKSKKYSIQLFRDKY